MTERTIAIIENELAEAIIRRDEAIQLAIKLKRELENAKVAAASHPWVGKRVERSEMRGYGLNRKTFTRRGTVALYDPKLHRALRELRTGYLDAGDPIVIHENGVTGWALEKYDWQSKSKVNDWTLAEEKVK